MRACFIALLLCSCGGDAGVQRLYGEVHIHGFAGGSHPSALFLAVGTPVSSVDGDSILPGQPPSDRAAGCTLFDGACTGCAPPPPPVDAGPVHIRGGAGIADVELGFVAAQRTYLPGAPVERAIFAGGESLAVDGDGAVAPAFRGAVIAPAPLVLTAPSAPGLGDGDFEVAWPADVASRVDVQLVASTSDGRYAIVECVADDSAGRVALPGSLLRRLPPRPRDLQLEASRDQLTVAKSVQSGDGVVLHAGYAVQLHWHED